MIDLRRPTERRRPRRVLASVALVGLLAVFGCGSDDSEPSAEEQFCSASDDLRASVSALTELDLLAEGTDGVGSALDEIEAAAGELTDSAPAAAEEEVTALETAVDGLGTALSDLGGDLSVDNLSGVSDAVGDVGRAASGVYEKLTSCE